MSTQLKQKMAQVALIPGDGIGPEVCEAAVLVAEAAGAEIAWTRLEAGSDVHFCILSTEVLTRSESSPARNGWRSLGNGRGNVGFQITGYTSGSVKTYLLQTSHLTLSYRNRFSNTSTTPSVYSLRLNAFCAPVGRC